MTIVRKNKHMKPTLTLAFVLLTGALNGQQCSIVAQDAGLEKIETGYAFTEGPAVAKDGSVYFTDQPNDRIYRWIAPNGDIYFTDAYYHRDYWPEGQQEIQEVRGVYRLHHASPHYRHQAGKVYCVASCRTTGMGTVGFRI